MRICNSKISVIFMTISQTFHFPHRMSRKWTTVTLEDVWNSPISQYLIRLISENWSSIGVLSEIEARLGRVSDKGFESGVSMKYFYRMKDYLQSRTYWTDKDGKSITPEVLDEYAVIFEQNYRVIYIKKGNEYQLLEAIRKSCVEKETYYFDENHYSLRISLSQETPISQYEKDKYCQSALAYLKGESVDPSTRISLVRHRERITFNFNNEYIIDMTTIQSSESLSSLSHKPTFYEVECEMGLPRYHFCQSTFIFLNGILKRLFSLPESISMPPINSIFHPSNFNKIILREHNSIILTENMMIELKNADGYDDELITWCKSQNDDKKPILYYNEAKQVQWSLSHPPSMNTLFGKEYDTKASNTDRLLVSNQGGTIRTKDGHVFHCCVWQYEGILINQTQSVRRYLES